MRKKAAYMIIFIFISIIALPALVVTLINLEFELQTPQETARENPQVNINNNAQEMMVKLWDTSERQLIEIPLEQYIAGVVAAEMPVSFQEEALKAQAVVARTYTLYKMSVGGCGQHDGAHVCTDYTCCQAWENQESVLNKWSSDKQKANQDKINEAVADTRGLILEYGGEPINAVFHSTCGGHTDDSEEVWSGQLPYLRASSCSYCSHSPWWEKETVYSLEEFSRLVSSYPQASPASAYLEPAFSSLDRSDTRRVKTLKVNNLNLTGHELRNLLNLPSTKVSWHIDGDNIVFSSQGYGHGVGMCQYGADGMALEGYDFRDILMHYYRDVRLVNHDMFN